MSRPTPREALKIVGDAMKTRANDWNAHPGLWLKVDEESTVTVRLGRHKVVALAHPREDGTWHAWGSAEVLAKHHPDERHRGERLHDKVIAPRLAAAGLAMTSADRPLHAAGGIDIFSAFWCGLARDPSALADMLWAFLGVETAWGPDGRIDWDSYRPCNFEHPEPRMSVFCYPTLGHLTAPELVLRSVGTATLTAGDVVAVDRTGPPIAGRSTRWATWRIRDGAPDAICTSMLDGGDPDDPDFPTREGLVAWVDGTTTVYVACKSMDERSAPHELPAEIVAAAAHPFFAPQGTSDRPIAEEVVTLRDKIVRELRVRNCEVCTSGSNTAAFTVYATTGWVQVDVPGEGAVLVATAESGTFEVQLLPDMDLGEAVAPRRGLDLAEVIEVVTTPFAIPVIAHHDWPRARGVP